MRYLCCRFQTACWTRPEKKELKKIRHILLVLPGIGFFLVPGTVKAVGQQQGIDIATSQVMAKDTTLKKDSLVSATLPVNDPKLEFRNLFSTAVTGDGVNGAKLNPLAISFVQDYIARNGKGFKAMKDWAKPYLDMMDEILTQHGVPKEMKYLAVIESGLKYNAISFSGAVGPWAFMPSAAKEYGLKMTKYHDDRLDYFKSTHAAASLLTDLYKKYGDWLLVIAAYNGGPGNVNKAIKKSGGSKDFWTLQYYLPNESMNHVKKFIATHYIFEGEGGITTVTKNELKDLVVKGGATLAEEEMKNSTSYNITGRFSSAVIIKYIDMDMATFIHYNPGFDNEIAINGKYELRLPTQKMNIFVAKRYEILDESIQLLLKSANGGTH
jgi:membrane-bound lytic murein transglycosylase D